MHRETNCRLNYFFTIGDERWDETLPGGIKSFSRNKLANAFSENPGNGCLPAGTHALKRQFSLYLLRQFHLRMNWHEAPY